ncbi:hypothetical protein [Bradyrhizobium cenepequi]|uniref:hypothetical protein n=1 Tax=Bradyrhizobium cenepequi TaxID=2821403 RepID=UPI001CE2985D|nr:hypothetical protein [Bradyrhizobium cenepequi]MCA6111596.1 hypothetical protein [Bradyrhizobium cenepequi]
MQKPAPKESGADLIATMRRLLDVAAAQVAERDPTPATKARMAQRIVQLTSEGVTDPEVLVAAAIDEAGESE